MSDSKLECTDSYILPQGPIGDKGPIGQKGEQGARGSKGPTGDIGIAGRSKIDIRFTGIASTVRENISTTDGYRLLGTFIYPGNTAFGGDPQGLKMVYSATGLLVQNINTIDIALVELRLHSSSISTTSLINDYATVLEPLTLVGGGNSLVPVDVDPSIGIITDNLDNLSDNEVLVGIYAGSAPSGSSIKFHSAELY
jgi:hypothetical protein